MNAAWMTRAIWGAGAVQLAIIAANIPLPGKLRVRERRQGIRVGIPRVLNLYSTGPLWRGYFETVGIRPERIPAKSRDPPSGWRSHTP